MSEWKTRQLKELTVKIGSGSTPTGGSNAYKLTGIPLIRSQNILDYTFSTSGLVFIDDEQAYSLRNVTIEKNDVLINITGDSVARCCTVPTAFVSGRVNQHVAILRADASTLHSQFLKYSILAAKDELLVLSEIGGTRNALTKKMLEEFELQIPLLPEQKAIASVLSSLDDKIDLLHRQNKTLEAMAETLFQQWFVEEAKEDWEQLSFMKWIKETKGGDWGKENPIDDFNQTAQCIRGTDIADMQKGLPRSTPIRYIKKKKLSIIMPKEGDIVLEISGGTETQSTGRCYFINNSVLALFSYPLVFSNFCRLLSVKQKEYSYFIYLYLRYLYNSDEFFALENGSSGIKNLNYKALLTELKYKMPPESLVLNFHDYISVYFDKLLKNKLQIQTLEKLRDTLLPKLMSGEVRVKY